MQVLKRPGLQQQVSIQCHEYIHNKRNLFAGLTDGDILQWRPKMKLKSDMLSARLPGHRGPVTCLTYTAAWASEGLLIRYHVASVPKVPFLS